MTEQAVGITEILSTVLGSSSPKPESLQHIPEEGCLSRQLTWVRKTLVKKVGRGGGIGECSSHAQIKKTVGHDQRRSSWNGQVRGEPREVIRAGVGASGEVILFLRVKHKETGEIGVLEGVTRGAIREHHADCREWRPPSAARRVVHGQPCRERETDASGESRRRVLLRPNCKSLRHLWQNLLPASAFFSTSPSFPTCHPASPPRPRKGRLDLT